MPLANMNETKVLLKLLCPSLIWCLLVSCTGSLGAGGAERVASGKPRETLDDEGFGRRKALLLQQHGQYSFCAWPQGRGSTRNDALRSMPTKLSHTFLIAQLCVFLCT